MLEQRIASVRTRPVRYAFIVNQNITKDQLRLVFQTNCLFWGGYQSAFIPTDGENIREDWWIFLYRHNPDYIVLVGEISRHLRLKMYDEIQPFKVFDWDEGWLQHIYDGTDQNGTSIWTIFQHHYHENGLIDPSVSHYRYPVIEDSQYSLFYELLCGTYPSKRQITSGHRAEDVYKEYLGAKDILCTPSSLQAHIELVDQWNRKVSPLDFARHYTKSSHSPVNIMYPKGFTIVVSDGMIDDLFIYHVSRWSANPAIFVLVEDIENDTNLNLLANHIGSKIRGNVLSIGSLSKSLEWLREFREHFRPCLPKREHQWHINIGSCHLKFPMLNLIHRDRKQQIVSIRDRTLTFTSEPCKFNDTSSNPWDRWIAEVNLSPKFGNRQGFLPSTFRSLNFLLSETTDKDLYYQLPFSRLQRIARGHLAHIMSKEIEIGRFHLPSEEAVFKAVIEDAGFTISLHENKGRYYKNMVRLTGELSDIRFMRDETMLQLFYDISNEKERHQDDKRFVQRAQAYTLKELSKFTGSSKSQEELGNLIQELTGKGVFFRGYNFKCEHCDFTTWYSIEELAEWISCKGCHQFFQPSVRYEHFAYQLNQLFLQGLIEGAASVILTALFIYELSQHSLMWQSGYKIGRHDFPPDTDIDLIAMSDGALILGECKNSIDTKPHKIAKLIDQLEKNIEAALALDAHIFFFTTLHEGAIPEKIEEFLLEKDATMDRLRVCIVRREELISGQLFRKLEAEDERQVTPLTKLVKVPVMDKQCFEFDPHSKGYQMFF